MARTTIRHWIAAVFCVIMTSPLGVAKAETTQGSPAPEVQQRSDIAAQGFVGLTRRDARVPGEVVLTFDDGPHIYHTPRVLQLLERQSLHATFFLVGANITRHTFLLVQRMQQAGHPIGSHSYNHDVRMADGRFGAATSTYIRGQHEVTQILVELALLARSGAEFDALYRQVFATNPVNRLSERSLMRDWPIFVARHRELLDSRGYSNGERVYPIAFTRPPGGGPYYGTSGSPAKQRYDLALRELGWLNILWHDGCWDPDQARRNDHDFITSSLRSQFLRGGVIVIHDYVRLDALTHALLVIPKLAHVKVVSLEQVVEVKYGTGVKAVVASLQHPCVPAPKRFAQNTQGASRQSI